MNKKTKRCKKKKKSDIYKLVTLEDLIWNWELLKVLPTGAQVGVKVMWWLKEEMEKTLVWKRETTGSGMMMVTGTLGTGKLILSMTCKFTTLPNEALEIFLSAICN